MNSNKNISEYEKVPINELTLEKEKCPRSYGYGVRHIQLFIFLLCLTCSIIGRGHMGVTIVAMTSNQQENTEIQVISHSRSNNNTNIFEDSINGGKVIDSNLEHNIINNYGNINVTEVKPMVYNWPKSVQEMVLNGFFLGYTIMMFPMGMVCQRFGGKLPLQISLITNAAICFVTPWLTLWGGWKATCGCRILQGLSQAGTYPSIQALLSKWVPVDERATLSSCVYTGLTVGTVIAYHIAGFLGASRWGWPSIFYAVGVISLICFILLTIFGTATPLEHKSITEEERNYILGSENAEKPRRLNMPWRAMFTSTPLWGTIVAQIGGTVGFVFFFNQVPTYIHYILNVNVKNSGLLSSLPYVASIFSTLGFGWLSDYLINRNIISMKNARRICNSISLWGIAVCLILTTYTNNTAVAVSCLVVTLTINMAGHAGWMINHIDLAPNFSGTMMAIGNTLSNIFVLLTPVVISFVVTDTTNQLQWRIMFFIMAGITFFCNTIFIVLMSSDIQPWNYASYNDMNVEDLMQDNKKKENLIRRNNKH